MSDAEAQENVSKVMAESIDGICKLVQSGVMEKMEAHFEIDGEKYILYFSKESECMIMPVKP
jgi:hypothetical protein